MKSLPLKPTIMHINSADIAGGAEKVGWNIHQGCRTKGYNSWLAVGNKRSRDRFVLEIPNFSCKAFWRQWLLQLEKSFERLSPQMRGVWRLRKAMAWLAEPKRQREISLGKEDFGFPGTWELLNLLPDRPNIIHCHNLHRRQGFFDLRALPWLSQKVPVVLTLHDAWMLGGHCAHSFGCSRWKTGCGQCPDISNYLPIRQDSSAYNWERKRSIYLKSRLYIATPSLWLMNKVKQSILKSAIIEARVIPNGVDLGIFHVGNKKEARKILRIPYNINVLLFVANSTKSNRWKDFQTLKSALERLKTDKEVWLLCLGEKGKEERLGKVYVRFLGYEQKPQVVAYYYQAADIYIHAARAEVWGLTITEALACGKPVIATAVGGIPEQVKGWQVDDLAFGRLNLEGNRYGIDEATGILTQPGDAEAMCFCIQKLLQDNELLGYMAENAERDARERFNLEKQVKEYLEWYKEIFLNFN